MGKLEHRFWVSVKGETWEILLVPDKHQLDPDEGQGVVIADYIHGVSDGGEFQVVMGFTNAAVKVANRAIASRGPGAIPFKVSPEVMELWYAFASHLYLSRKTNNLLIPIEGTSSDPRSQTGYPGSWRCFDTAPQLPQEIFFWGPALKDSQARQILIPTNIHLRVLESTNLGKCQLPLSVETVYYFPAGTNIIVKGQTQIYVKRFSLDSQIHGFPVLPGMSAISDFRFATNPLSRAFAGLTDAWPSDEVVRKIGSARAAHPSNRNLIRIVLLVTVFLIPGALLTLHAFRSPDNRNQTNKHEDHPETNIGKAALPKLPTALSLNGPGAIHPQIFGIVIWFRPGGR